MTSIDEEAMIHWCRRRFYEYIKEVLSTSTTNYEFDLWLFWQTRESNKEI